MRFFTSLFLLPSVSYALQALETWSRERIQLQDTSIFFRVSASGKPPILLVHGFPEDSHTWDTIGPILAENFTVIAPDNRGCGQSALSASDNYTAPAGASDLAAVLAFLNITKTLVLAHDKGVGLATALALEYPSAVSRIALVEYPLPGTEYYSTCVRSPELYYDWQLAFFSVPDAAEFFIRGREKEMLAWYYYHGSYSGNDAVSNDLLEYYTRTISKPGFLRSGMKYFAAAWDDAKYFGAKLAISKLQMPLLYMGGEASLGVPFVLNGVASSIANNYTTAIIPKSGHWIGVENPTWVANKVADFMLSSTLPPAVDLSFLNNLITMSGNDGAEQGFVTPGTNRTIGSGLSRRRGDEL